MSTPTQPEQPAATPSKAEAIAKIVEMRKALERQGALEHSGAASNATATTMLDKAEAESLNPGKRLRWVNVRNAEKAQLRQASGYERVPESEGGRQVGNLALFRLPGAEYDRRVAKIAKLGKDRLEVHNKQAEQFAEKVARELRDKHNIDVNPEQIFGTRGADPRK